MGTFEEAVAAQRAAGGLPEGVASHFAGSADDLAQGCAVAAHTLRHEGAPPQQWQPWLALAAGGALVGGRPMLARSLALLSWVYGDLADAMSATEPVPSRAPNHALLHLLRLLPPDAAPKGPDRERLELIAQGFDDLTSDDCFALLAEAIDQEDWDRCGELFDSLAGFALENHPGNWDPEVQPGYEPVPAAICVLARQRGFPPDVLGAAARGWLWPAIESAPGLTPVVWPLDLPADAKADR